MNFDELNADEMRQHDISMTEFMNDDFASAFDDDFERIPRRQRERAQSENLRVAPGPEPQPQDLELLELIEELS